MEDMANPALTAGRAIPRRRALFGLFDADGWAWASVKAAAWFVIIIILLGYIPDRAYYFTVDRNLKLGLLAWSPINLCPPINETVPCPAPAGAVLPWYPAPSELKLPEPRVDGSAAQVGSRVYYIGGTSGSGATDTVFVAPTSGIGNYSLWETGPALPEPRTDAAVAVFSGSIYVIGGADADGAPTSTVFKLTPPLTGDLPAWETVDDLALSAPVAGAATAAAADGIFLIGGVGESGPVVETWKTTADTKGVLGAWAPQAKLVEPNTDGVATVVGDYVWLMGGDNGNGPVRSVQQGVIGTGADTGAGVGGEAASPSANPSAAPGVGTAAESISIWRVSEQTNLPEPRTDVAGFSLNNTLYVMGGSDGSNPHADLWWATPDATGGIPGWKHLDQSDLKVAVTGASAYASGSNAFVFGGTSPNGATNEVQRANMAPQEPFFQLGILGMTVPALKIDGEIGQQLGYLNAAGAGTVNFIILLLIGWAFAHKEQSRRIVARILRRKT
jgi:N-acetylneuraminic acid mutarotase